MATLQTRHSDHTDLHLDDDEPPLSFDDLGSFIRIDGQGALVVSIDVTFRNAEIVWSASGALPGCREITIAHRAGSSVNAKKPPPPGQPVRVHR